MSKYTRVFKDLTGKNLDSVLPEFSLKRGEFLGSSEELELLAEVNEAEAERVFSELLLAFTRPRYSVHPTKIAKAVSIGIKNSEISRKRVNNKDTWLSPIIFTDDFLIDILENTSSQNPLVDWFVPEESRKMYISLGVFPGKPGVSRRSGRGYRLVKNFLEAIPKGEKPKTVLAEIYPPVIWCLLRDNQFTPELINSIKRILHYERFLKS